MSNFTLLGSTFTLSKTSQEFLESYIKRVSTYISSNSLAESYTNDILERVVEKLDGLQKIHMEIPDADIIRLVNDIGEPEDIFPESGAKKARGTVEHLQFLKKSFKKNLDKRMIFGVCAGMADYFAIDVFWVRLFFVIFTLTWGAGILVYFVLALLLPVDTSSPQGHGSTLEKTPSDSLGKVQHQAIVSLGDIFSRIFQLIIVFISIFAAGILFLMFIGGTFASGFLLSGGIEFGNQFFPAIIPQNLLVGSLLITIALLVCSIAILGSAFGKYILGKSGWLSLVIFVGVGSILSVAGGLTVMKEYAWREVSTQVQTLSLSGSELTISNELRNISGSVFSNNIWGTVYLERSPTAKDVSITTKTEFYTKDAITAKSLLSAMEYPVFTLSGSTLLVTAKLQNAPSSKIPFSFPDGEIRIVVPEHITVTGNYFDITKEHSPKSKIH